MNHVSTYVPCAHILIPHHTADLSQQLQFTFSTYISVIQVFHDSFSSESLQWLFVVQLDSVHLWFICSSFASVLSECYTCHKRRGILVVFSNHMCVILKVHNWWKCTALSVFCSKSEFINQVPRAAACSNSETPKKLK